jgi:isopenicillin-N epimerase
MRRRDFARLVAFGGAATWPSLAGLRAHYGTAKLPETPASPDESYWGLVRQQFLIPEDVTVLCAANLTPTSLPVLETLDRVTRDIDRDPSGDNRRKWSEGRESARKILADFLSVSPEEIVFTRNTSEGNNIVSSGVDLKPGEEVVVFSDNHPSVNVALREKSKRFGFVIKTIAVPSPHPGADYYLEAVKEELGPKTRLLAFSHVTNTVGDLFPAQEMCRLARERGVLTLVDGAQTFGVLNLDLAVLQPDFFTGSAHKWPCGPKEFGVLYIRKDAQPKIWPSIISLYGGAVGASRTFEALGQRDEAGFIAFGEALKLQNRIGRKLVEERARFLARRFREGLGEISGVKTWTHPAEERSAAIVTFQPGNLDGGKLAAALYQKDKILTNARGGADRPGIRLSPHFYVLAEEVERTVAAVRRIITSSL